MWRSGVYLYDVSSRRPNTCFWLSCCFTVGIGGRFSRVVLKEHPGRIDLFLALFTPTALTTSCKDPCKSNSIGVEASDVL